MPNISEGNFILLFLNESVNRVLLIIFAAMPQHNVIVPHKLHLSQYESDAIQRHQT